MELKELIQVGFKEIRKGHWYTGTVNGVEHGPFPSVTKIKGIVDKSGPLMIWARREALKLAEQTIKEYLRHGEQLTEENLAELIAKADKQPDRVKDEAADIGSKIHDAIDLYINGQEPVLDDQSRHGYENFQKWLTSENIKLIKGDTSLVSIKHGFGGRADAYGLQNGELILMDWKSSKALYDDFALQLGGYAIATEETLGVMPKRAKVVRFGKTDPDDFEAKDVNVPNAVNAFLCALNLWKSLNSKEAKLWMK